MLVRVDSRVVRSAQKGPVVVPILVQIARHTAQDGGELRVRGRVAKATGEHQVVGARPEAGARRAVVVLPTARVRRPAHVALNARPARRGGGGASLDTALED